MIIDPQSPPILPEAPAQTPTPVQPALQRALPPWQQMQRRPLDPAGMPNRMPQPQAPSYQFGPYGGGGFGGGAPQLPPWMQQQTPPWMQQQQQQLPPWFQQMAPPWMQQQQQPPWMQNGGYGQQQAYGPQAMQNPWQQQYQSPWPQRQPFNGGQAAPGPFNGGAAATAPAQPPRAPTPAPFNGGAAAPAQPKYDGTNTPPIINQQTS